MTVELHRCANRWSKFGPCSRAQRALDEQGIAYQVVTGPWRPKNRATVISGTDRISWVVATGRPVVRRRRARR
jgi:hypothetical protein